MRVLHFINSLSIGGAERLVVDLVMQLKKENKEVDVLIVKRGTSPLLESVENKGIIKLYYLSENSSVYNPVHIFRLQRHVKKYDLVHVHLFPCLYWAAMNKIVFRNSYKLVYTEHSSNNKRRKNVFLKYLDRFVYKQYDLIITISKAVDIELRKHLNNSLSKKIELIYNGINLEVISNAKQYSISELGNFPEDAQIIVQVSSFRYPKDQKTVISALSLLPNNYYLILVGDGDLRSDCEEHSKALNVEHRTVFMGLRNDVPRLLKSSNFIVLSSHYEGLSLSSIEGMASGKPFIATNVPGLKEVVINAGLLFEYQDQYGLAKIIKKLSEDKEYYHEIVNSCQKRAKEYDIQFMADNYRKVYQKITCKSLKE